MEQAITNARREITMAESSLIYAKNGIPGQIEAAKQRLKNAAEILNEWSEK